MTFANGKFPDLQVVYGAYDGEINTFYILSVFIIPFSQFA